jgi:Trk K+ transport system NAD-binding subunit
MGLPRREALTVGVGMCGRAEIAFILAALALSLGAIDQTIFTALIFTAFVLNLFTPLALKGCAALLAGTAARQADATSGVVQIDKFSSPLVEERYEGQPLHVLPNVEGAVVIYGYGPEVFSLMEELDSRGLPTVVIEEDESVAQRLHIRGKQVVHAALAEESLDLRPLTQARALVVNGEDEYNALLVLRVREQGFSGPIVALVDNPNRRAAMQLTGVTAAFTPTHVLAAAIAVRASARIGLRVTGVEPHGHLLEIAEVRVHDESPLANKTLVESGIRAETGAHIVGQWAENELHSPPATDQVIEPGMILVAAGSPDSIKRLSEVARPITREGTIVVAGFAEIGSKLTEMLKDANEQVCIIDATAQPGVDVVGDVLDPKVLQRAGVATARVVILACENDSATLLAATVVRNYTPDVPIIACADLVENVGRIQQAGADFALSISQVAGQLLTYHVLGEMVSQQARIKLVKVGAGGLVGRNPLGSRIRERTGCSVVAVERDGEVLMDIPPSFVLAAEDAFYLCGTVSAFNHFYEEFAESRG